MLNDILFSISIVGDKLKIFIFVVLTSLLKETIKVISWFPDLYIIL